ncbi:MAG: hypothetical protein JHC98_08155 [Thermoleophilaceae bacterium]|nr:hypothetical protein [Thermoleophilaceae bacterium]
MSQLKTLVALAAVLVIALVAAGCGDDAEPAAESAAATAATGSTGDAMKDETAMKPVAPKRKRGQKEISTGTVGGYGKILQDGRGHTIYLFTKEKSSKSECYDACAEAWPPVTTTREPFAGKGVTQSRLGTTRRSDGSRQVTYNGHPLYYYVGETQADQVLCQAVEEFGGLWYIVNKRGKAITRKA